MGKITANQIPDALLAAIAIRHDAILVTADRSFHRFEGLEIRHLQAASSGLP